jgi:hypothetical protein
VLEDLGRREVPVLLAAALHLLILLDPVEDLPQVAWVVGARNGSFLGPMITATASAVGNTGCFKCKKEGHRADQCPDNKPAPATPKTSGAKSAGTGRKVSFTKLQLNAAVQEAVKNTVHETMAVMEKKGWQKP